MMNEKVKIGEKRLARKMNGIGRKINMGYILRDLVRKWAEQINPEVVSSEIVGRAKGTINAVKEEVVGRKDGEKEEGKVDDR